MNEKYKRVFRPLKNFMINAIINSLDKFRLSISNHHNNSREISLLYEYSDTKNPDKYLLKLTSEIYSDYIEDTKNYIMPKVNNQGEENSVWNKYLNKKTGEHYHLLPMIANKIKAKNIVEIGTFMGASAKSLLLNSNCDRIDTFDIFPWDKFPCTFLTNEDFISKKIYQHLSDLSIEKNFKEFTPILKSADLFFIDGPKNYFFENIFLNFLFKLLNDNKSTKKRIIILDDIKLSTYSKIWNKIDHPKITIDLIGHWSGTGLIII